MSVNICEICGNEFVAKRKDTKRCSKACKNVASRRMYSNRMYEHTCIACGDNYTGVKGLTRCKNCQDVRQAYDFKVKVEQNMCCRQCGDVVYKMIKNQTRYIPDKIFNITCKKCKHQNSIKRSNLMKEQNPMFNIESLNKGVKSRADKFNNDLEYRARFIAAIQRGGASRRGKSSSITPDGRKRISERMKLNNPMHNPDTVIKGTQTRKSSGHVYKRGPEHHLWKGTSNKASLIRTRLYAPWTRPILERDNFTCTICGASKCRLEVHHLSKSFKNILDQHLDGKHITEYNDEEFEVFSDKVINEHKTVEGITVCVKCHQDIDPQRR